MKVLAASAEPGILMVVLMGMITVFIGLICLIGIIKLMGLIMEKVDARKLQRKQAQVAAAGAPAPQAVSAAPAQVPGGKGPLVAAIAAAIAEELGEEVDHIRIHSIRRL